MIVAKVFLEAMEGCHLGLTAEYPATRKLLPRETGYAARRLRSDLDHPSPSIMKLYIQVATRLRSENDHPSPSDL